MRPQIVDYPAYLLLGALSIPAKFYADRASEQSCRVQLARDGLHISECGDRMHRRDIAKASRCECDKDK
jgi:hypothetical protein